MRTTSRALAAALTALLLLGPSLPAPFSRDDSARAAEVTGTGSPDGEWIVFHGWCPDSSCYAYTVVTLKTRHDRQRRTEEHRLVELRGKRRPRVRRYETLAQVRRRAHVSSFVGAPAPSTHPDDRSVRFPLDDGRVLTFQLVLGETLGYRLMAASGGGPSEVESGKYDDLYVETDAFAYVSPDGRKLALLVYGENPWKVRGEVHFMRLPAPPEAPRTVTTEAGDDAEGGDSGAATDGAGSTDTADTSGTEKAPGTGEPADTASPDADVAGQP